MQSLRDHLDRLLKFNEYPVFDGYKDFLEPDAERHARQELEWYLAARSGGSARRGL